MTKPTSSTGIVRRIDELGRVVIPKEIRKVLRIRDGEPLEILVDNEKILLKKFSVMDNYKDMAKTLVDETSKVIEKNVCITNRDMFIVCAGEDKKEFIDKPISSYLERLIVERKAAVNKAFQETELVKGERKNYYYCISPIINEGNILGLVIICSSTSTIATTDEKFALVCAQFLEKYIEE